MTEPMAEPAATAPAVDAQGRIDTDLPCVGCGYNLRGLLPDGTCPECALPISQSTGDNSLRFSDPKWLETLASGTSSIGETLMLGVLGGRAHRWCRLPSDCAGRPGFFDTMAGGS